MTTATAQTLMANALSGSRSKREAVVQSDIEQLCGALGRIR